MYTLGKETEYICICVMCIGEFLCYDGIYYFSVAISKQTIYPHNMADLESDGGGGWGGELNWLTGMGNPTYHIGLF